MKITDIDPGRADELSDIIRLAFSGKSPAFLELSARQRLFVLDLMEALYDAARRPATCPTNCFPQPKLEESAPFPLSTPVATSVDCSEGAASPPKCGWTDLENEEY